MANNAYRKRRRPPPESSICYPPPKPPPGPIPPAPPHERFPCTPPPILAQLELQTHQFGNYIQDLLDVTPIGPEGDYQHTFTDIDPESLDLTFFTIEGIPQAFIRIIQANGQERTSDEATSILIREWSCSPGYARIDFIMPPKPPHWSGDSWNAKMFQFFP